MCAVLSTTKKRNWNEDVLLWDALFICFGKIIRTHTQKVFKDLFICCMRTQFFISKIYLTDASWFFMRAEQWNCTCDLMGSRCSNAGAFQHLKLGHWNFFRSDALAICRKKVSSNFRVNIIYRKEMGGTQKSTFSKPTFFLGKGERHLSLIKYLNTFIPRFFLVCVGQTHTMPQERFSIRYMVYAYSVKPLRICRRC